MSELTKTLRKWRVQGSLRYLAHALEVTPKQIARYCDNGWVHDSYRTPKGHRRIRYTSTTEGRIGTVGHVSRMVSTAKETNIAIRYHIPSIDHCGTVIPLEGCNKMHDVYKRARKVGLNDREARNAAFVPRGGNTAPCDMDITWDTMLALKNVSRHEVGESSRKFSCLPLGYLLDFGPVVSGTTEEEVKEGILAIRRARAERNSSPDNLDADGTKLFRARAEEVWQGILADHKSREEWNLSPDNCRREERRKTLETLRDLLAQPDPKSFVAAWKLATEVHHRITKDDSATYRAVNARVDQDPTKVRLQTAALSLKHKQETPTAAALAKALGISRPALYRAFGAVKIRAALAFTLLQDDAVAIAQSKELQPDEGEESEWNAGADGV